MNLKPIFLSLFFAMLAFLQIGISQISSVKYQLKFDESTGFYDVYLIAQKGNAKTIRDRVQFNSQISLVVPTSTKVAVAQSIMPIQNNFSMQGGKPMPWLVSSELVAPSVAPKNDFVAITPSMNPTSFFNEVKEGEAVKLFSLKVTPLPVCKSDIRLFENELDPSSDVFGMGGGDFNNGYTIGGIEQKYNGNIQTFYSESPQGNIGNVAPVKIKGTIKLNAGSWSNASSFIWKGPKGYTSTEKNPSIKYASKSNEGIYSLVVTGKNGCTSLATVNVSVIDAESLEAKSLDESNAITASVQTEGRSLSTSDIYPNPASDNFTVIVNAKNGANINVDILDNEGKLVRKSVVTAYSNGQKFEAKVGLNNLQAGVYVISVSIDAEVINHKLIVVK